MKMSSSVNRLGFRLQSWLVSSDMWIIVMQKDDSDRKMKTLKVFWGFFNSLEEAIIEP